MRACSAPTAEGTLWPVDAAAAAGGQGRPAGAHLASHRAYYERWAKTWEFQALLKARPVAGDLELGQALRRRGRAAGLVGRRAATNFVEDVQAMRRRVERARAGRARPTASSSSARAGCATSSSACSCCSSCTAAADEPLRSRHDAGRRSTRSPPAATSAATTPRRSTRPTGFLRTLEHRIQLYRLRRTHVMPDRRGRPAPARPRARAPRATRRERGGRAVAAPQAREVRRLHEKLFYRPLLDAVARLSAERGAADPGGRASSGSRRSATATRPARCATSRR